MYTGSDQTEINHCLKFIFTCTLISDENNNKDGLTKSWDYWHRRRRFFFKSSVLGKLEFTEKTDLHGCRKSNRSGGNKNLATYPLNLPDNNVRRRRQSWRHDIHSSGRSMLVTRLDEWRVLTKTFVSFLQTTLCDNGACMSVHHQQRFFTRETISVMPVKTDRDRRG